MRTLRKLFRAAWRFYTTLNFVFLPFAATRRSDKYDTGFVSSRSRWERNGSKRLSSWPFVIHFFCRCWPQRDALACADIRPSGSVASSYHSYKSRRTAERGKESHALGSSIHPTCLRRDQHQVSASITRYHLSCTSFVMIVRVARGREAPASSTRGHGSVSVPSIFRPTEEPHTVSESAPSQHICFSKTHIIMHSAAVRPIQICLDASAQLRPPPPPPPPRPDDLRLDRDELRQGPIQRFGD